MLDKLDSAFLSVGRVYAELTRLRLRVFTDWNDYEMKLLGACVLAFCVLFFLLLGEQVRKMKRYATVYWVLRKIPGINYLVRKQFEKARKDAMKTLPKTNLKITKALPKEGLKLKEVKKRLEDFEDIENELRKKGKYSGSVYSTEEDLVTLNKEVSKLFLFTDLAQPQIYRYSKQLENEVVSMLINLFKGHSRCAGLTTTGGSESLELTVLAHCAHYRRKKGITRPEVLVCETVHASIYKACEFFDVKLVVVGVDRDLRFDLRAFERAITANTVLMVSSVPNYPYGYCDPVDPLAKLALKHDIGLHLDMCMGGFLVPFAKDLGYKLPELAYDFTVKGVSSISVDPHKYGLCAKGVGVLLFSEHEIQQALYFCKADGPSPPYVSGTIFDSRSAAVVAACWATMVYYGYEGYSRLAKEIFEKSTELCTKLRKIPDISVVGDPILGNIAFRSTDKQVSIYSVANYVSMQEWKTSCTPKRPCMHLTLHKNNIEKIDDLVDCISKGFKKVKKSPKSFVKGPHSILNLMNRLPTSLGVAAVQTCYHEFFQIANLEPAKDPIGVKEKSQNAAPAK